MAAWPSGRIAHTWGTPERVVWNASHAPSGDQAGSVSAHAPLATPGPSPDSGALTMVCAEPSGCMTYSRGGPFRVLENAMVLPFGDHAGSVFSPFVSVSTARPLPLGRTS